MDLEEHTLEEVGDICEECGAKLTPQELQVVMESGGPALCSVHADEMFALDDDHGFEAE
jgi:methionyl-tRNA synthetase